MKGRSRRDLSIKEILKRCPEAKEVLEGHGLACAGCEAFLLDDLEEAASVHGIDPEALIKDLERLL